MFREQQSCRPEVRLQSEINLLTLEKVGPQIQMWVEHIWRSSYSSDTDVGGPAVPQIQMLEVQLFLRQMLELQLFLRQMFQMLTAVFPGGAGEEAGVHHQV